MQSLLSQNRYPVLRARREPQHAALHHHAFHQHRHQVREHQLQQSLTRPKDDAQNDGASPAHGSTIHFTESVPEPDSHDASSVGLGAGASAEAPCRAGPVTRSGGCGTLGLHVGPREGCPGNTISGGGSAVCRTRSGRGCPFTRKSGVARVMREGFSDSSDHFRPRLPDAVRSLFARVVC